MDDDYFYDEAEEERLRNQILEELDPPLCEEHARLLESRIGSLLRSGDYGVVKMPKEGSTMKMYIPHPKLTWTLHNLVAHPLSEVCHLLGWERASNWLHEVTVPPHEKGTGRG